MTQGLLNSGLYSPPILRPYPTNYGNDVYWSNDRDAKAVNYFNDQSTMYAAGIKAPTSITVGLDTSAGAAFIPSTYPFTFGFRYRYVNQNKPAPGNLNFYVSNPSPSGLSRPLDSNDAPTVTVTASADPKVTHIALEVTKDAGGSWELLQFVSNTSTTHTFPVKVGTSGVILPWDDIGHEIPPADGRVQIAHKNSLFLTHFETEVSGTVTLATTGDSTPVLTRANDAHKWGPAMSGRFFKLDDANNSDIIKNVDSETGLTLASGYGTVATNGAYSISPSDANIVYYSKALLPESFDLGNNSFRVLVNANDRPIAMASYFDYIIFFGEHSIEGMQYQNDPADGTFSVIDLTRGAVNQECVIKVDSALYVLDRAGIYAFTGQRPQPISGPIDEILEGRANGWAGIDWTGAENKFFAVHNPDLRQIEWHVTLNRTGESTDMTKALIYNYDDNTWVISDFLNSMRCGSSLPDENGQVRPIFGTKEGGMWVMKDATTDGVPDSQSVVSGIIAPNATTTTFSPSGVSLYALNQGLKHCAIVIDGIGSGTIASNTSSSITLNEALSSEPAAGTAFYIAPIQMKVLTRATAIKSPTDKSIFTYLELLHEPPTDTGDAEQVKVRVKLDYSSSYTNFATSAKTLVPGVRVEADALDTAIVSLKEVGYHSAGYIRIPMPSTAFHVAEIEILTDEPRNSFKLNAIFIRGKSGELIEI